MVASFLPVGANFFMLPIYSRYLSLEDYGAIALVLTFQAFLPLIMSLQIHSSISRFYFEFSHNETQLKVFISTVLVIIFFVSTTWYIAIFFYMDVIISFLFPQTIGYNDVFILGLTTSFISVFTSVFTSLIRVLQKAKLYMKTSLSIFLFALVENVYQVIVLKKGAVGVVEASLWVSLVSFVLYAFLVKKYFTYKINLNVMKGPLIYSLPLIPHSVSGMVFLYSDRIILERYVTLGMIGLYMFADKIALLFKMLVDEFNKSFTPYFNEMSKGSKERAKNKIKDLSLIVLYLLVVLVVVFSAFSVEVIGLVFDKRYFNSWVMIPYLAIAYVCRNLYQFAVCGLFYEKRTGIVALITIVAGALNVVINLIFIPKYGVIAAVYSTVFSFFISFVLADILSRKVYYLELKLKKISVLLVYLFLAIYLLQKINMNYQNFSTKDYLCKLAILGAGFFLGHKLKLHKFGLLLKVRT